MANNKSKKTTNKKSSKPVSTKTKEVKKTEKVEVETAEIEAKTEKVEAPKEVVEETGNPFKGFFACKHDEKENILTIFKSPRIWGALIGEAVGMMILTMILLTLGVYQPLYLMFGLVAITAAVYGLSGANLNPIVTVGMMVTRRMSVIRGVLYMIAQVVGAWLGLALVNVFVLQSDGAAELTVMSEIESDQFWIVTMIEFIGAILIAFFFARALVYKKSPLTFAVIVGMGTCVALLFAIVVSSNFLSLQNNFALNPAVALMYKILPTSGDNFGQVLGETMLALVTYWIFPLLGGVAGFFISDIAGRLKGETAKCGCEKCSCEKCEAAATTEK